MGTRVIFRVFGSESAPEDGPVAVLYSNSSHPDRDAEDVFNKLAAVADGPTDLVEHLLRARYQDAGGNHRAGDRIFWLAITASDECDIESIVEYRNGRVHKGTLNR